MLRLVSLSCLFLTEFQKITISASKWASVRNLVLETDFTKISYIFEAKCRGVSNLSSLLLLMNLCFRCPLHSLNRLPPLKADLFDESRISLMWSLNGFDRAFVLLSAVTKLQRCVSKNTAFFKYAGFIESQFSSVTYGQPFS